MKTAATRVLKTLLPLLIALSLAFSSPLLAEKMARQISVLTPDYSLISPGFIPSHSWSADGQRVALLAWAGDVYILDLATRGLPSFPAGEPASAVMLSPDGRQYAVLAARQLRAYTAEPATLLGQANAVLPCLFSVKEGAAFTPDGKSIWVRCRQEALENPSLPAATTPAVKFALPNLQQAEIIEGVNTSTALRHPTGYVFATGDKSVLLEITESKVEPNKAGDRSFSLACMDLDTRQDCFAPFALGGTQPTTPRIYRISQDLSIAAVGITVGEGRADQMQTRIDVYRTANGEKQISLVVPDDMAGHNLLDVAVAKSGEFIIGAFDEKRDQTGGGLVVWETSCGRVAQGIQHPIDSLSLSPDQQRLISLSKHDIRICRVKFQ